MASENNYIGIAMGLDVTDLKSGLSEANKRIQESNSEFKRVVSGMDDWTKSTDGLKAKIKQLSAVLESQEKKVAGLQAEYDEVVKSQGESSEAARKLRVQLNNQISVVNKTKRELENYEDTLKKAEDGTIDLENVTLKAGKAIEKAGKEAEEAESGFTVMKGAMANLVAAGISKVVEGLKMVSVAFKEMIVDTDNASKKFQSLTGIAGEELKEFNTQIQALYDSNYGESMTDIAEAMALVAQSSQETDPSKIQELTKNALTLRDTFGFDIAETMRGVNMLMNEFGLSGEEAFNLIVQGAQKGLNKNGDLLDVINEYAIHYKQLGYDSEEFFNSLINGAAEGSFSVDKLGDAMKEFGIRTKDGSETTKKAFVAIGLTVKDSSAEIENAKKEISGYETQIAKLEKNLKYAEMQQAEFNDKTSELTKIKMQDNIAAWTEELETLKGELSISVKALEELEANADTGGQSAQELFARFAAGGEEAKKATNDVLTALFEMEDQVAQDAAGVALFGTMWEDLGKDAIKALMDTNGEISKTAEAMEEVNDVSYASVEKELRGLGRTYTSQIFQPLAKKVIPKIKEFIKYLKSDKVVNKFGDALEWLGDNFKEIVTVVGASVIAFKSFKAILAITNTIRATTTAINALGVGVGVATKAQAGLNAVMSANPFGAVLAAVGLLAAGIAALVITQKNATVSTGLLTKAQEEVIETARDNAEAYRETKEAAQELSNAELANIDYSQRLYKELQNITDENGKVKDGYESRAKFILNELNNALGTEYTMTGNMIDQYGQLRESIEDVINAKKAQILMEAHEESYRKAIENVAAAEQARALQAQEIALQEEKWRQKEAEYLALREELDEKIANQKTFQDQMEINSLDRKVKAFELVLLKEKKILDDKTEAYNKSEKELYTYYSDISNYEKAHTLLLEGKTAEAISYLNDLNQGFKSVASTAELSAEEQKKILGQQVVDTEVNAKLMKEAYEDGIEGVTEEMVKTAEDQARAAKEEFFKVGGDITKGIAEGAEDEEWTLSSAMAGLIDKAIAAAKKAGGIESPSKVARKKVGRWIGRGVGVGLLDSVPEVEKDIKKFNGAIFDELANGYTVGDLSSSISSKAGMMNSSKTSPTNNQATNAQGTTINAGMTVNYNGKLSRKELKQLENDNYTSIRMKLKTQGGF